MKRKLGKVCIFFDILLCLISCLCCKSQTNEFTPIHIDAPVISIKAKDVHYAIISFEPVENASYYSYFYSDDNETFLPGSVYYDSETTSFDVYISNYTTPFFYKVVAYDKKPIGEAKNTTSKSDFSNTVSICLSEDDSLEITELTASYANDSVVSLSWKELKGASSYNVYYGITDNIDDMQLALNTENSSENVTNLDFSTYYYFCVKPVINNEEKAASNIASYNLSHYIHPIENITGSISLIRKNGIKYLKIILDWDKAQNAEWYTVNSYDLPINPETMVASSNHWEEEISEFSVRGGLPDSVEEINFSYTTKYRYHFSITGCGRNKFISSNNSIELRLNETITGAQKTKADNDIGLKIEQSPAYPLVISWNKIDGISKYRLWYSYKTVDYQNAHHEDIEGTSKKFYGAWNSIYYFWLEPLPETGSFTASTPIYGIHPQAPSYDKETLDNTSSQGSSSSNNSHKHSYTYYMSQYEYYYKQYCDYLQRAYIRKAKGDNAGYRTYMSMAKGSKTSANTYYRWALECL